jgi:hypothetical protein
MAARARELGLEARAERLMKERETQFIQAGFLRGAKIQIELLKRLGESGSEHGLINDLNFFETITAIFKSTVGPAALYIPMGFVQSGFGFAIPMLVLSYVMIAWSSSNLLVQQVVIFVSELSTNPLPLLFFIQSTARHHNMGYSALTGHAFGSSGTPSVHITLLFASLLNQIETYFNMSFD